MRWIPEDSAWWRKAVLKANGQYDRLPVQPNEVDEHLAWERLNRAVAQAEVSKCRAMMAVGNVVKGDNA